MPHDHQPPALAWIIPRNRSITRFFGALVAMGAAWLVPTLPLAARTSRAPTSAELARTSTRSPVPARRPEPIGPTTTAAPVPPKAWILVDADTGKVIDGTDVHTPMRPASLTKILTALAVVESVPPDATIPVSARAEGMPAAKINMKAGQVWSFDDAFHSMLLSSANDAAVALAERADGNLDAFSQHLRQVAAEIGLQDNPTLNDPAGLDDAEFSFGGGNLLSARDLAIATRSALASAEVASAVSDPVYSFVGPDGAHHKLGNHNKLLKLYPGAIGVKTGYTRQAGNTYIGAARRDGRTMIVVLLGASDVYATTSAYLDKGFATPVSAEPSTDQLPGLHTVAFHGQDAGPRTADPPAELGRPATVLTAHHQPVWATPPALALELLTATVGVLRLRARRRRRRRVGRRAPASG
ncbi:MAG TPA: hypothetical protein VF954_02825 [Acidimicrobiales bacterium]